MLNLLESFEDLNSIWIEWNSGCYFGFLKVWQAFKHKAVFLKKNESPWIGEQCLVLAPYPWFGDKKQKIELKGHFSEYQKII